MEEDAEIDAYMTSSCGSGTENIVIHRQLLLQDTMEIQELPKAGGHATHASPRSPPLTTRLLRPSTWMAPREQKPRLMRIQLIRLNSSAKSGRESELLPVIESTTEVSCRVLRAEEMGGNLLALHLTPIGEARRKRMAYGCDGSTDVIIEEFSTGPTTACTSRLVVATSDRIFHLLPEGNLRLVWADTITNEMGDGVRTSINWKTRPATIAMATRSTSSCSPRNGTTPALVAFSEKTNKVAFARRNRPRSGAFADAPDDLPSVHPPEQESDGFCQLHLGRAFVQRDRMPITSEILTTSRFVCAQRRGHTAPPNGHRHSCEFPPLNFAPFAGSLPPTGSFCAAGPAGAADRLSAISSVSSASTPPATPYGLLNRTLYQLAQSVEQNPQLLSEQDREYRLDGIAVDLDIDHSRFKREVLDPRLPAHSALHKALFLVKEKLVSSGSADCSLRLTNALVFAGLYELSEIYKELCQREPVDSGLSYGFRNLLTTVEDDTDAPVHLGEEPAPPRARQPPPVPKARPRQQAPGRDKPTADSAAQSRRNAAPPPPAAAAAAKACRKSCRK